MVAMLVDKLMSACCGDSALMSVFKTKLPWNKNHKDDDDDDVKDTKKFNFSNKKKGKFSDKEMKYGLTKWKDLPLKARRAAEELGYSANKWDGSEYVDVDGKDWHDLTEAEVKAVTVLGWEQAAWEHKYEHNSWKDLPELQKKAATSSGFTEEMWDGDEWPENLHKHWDDLTEEDRYAMTVLGWHKNSWD